MTLVVKPCTGSGFFFIFLFFIFFRKWNLIWNLVSQGVVQGWAAPTSPRCWRFSFQVYWIRICIFSGFSGELQEHYCIRCISIRNVFMWWWKNLLGRTVLGFLSDLFNYHSTWVQWSSFYRLYKNYVMPFLSIRMIKIIRKMA